MLRTSAYGACAIRCVTRRADANSRQGLEHVSPQVFGASRVIDPDIGHPQTLRCELNRKKSKFECNELITEVTNFARGQNGALISAYCSFAYSDLASFRMGMSGSASCQTIRKS
jgi:hypothetical protein